MSKATHLSLDREMLSSLCRAHHLAVASAALAVSLERRALGLGPHDRAPPGSQSLDSARQAALMAKTEMAYAILDAVPAATMPSINTDDLTWLARSTPSVTAASVMISAVLRSRGIGHTSSDFNKSCTQWVRQKLHGLGERDPYRPKYGDGCRIEAFVDL